MLNLLLNWTNKMDELSIISLKKYDLQTLSRFWSMKFDVEDTHSFNPYKV